MFCRKWTFVIYFVHLFCRKWNVDFLMFKFIAENGINPIVGVLPLMRTYLGSIPGTHVHACFREISPPCELFTSRLHVKDPLLTAQDVSRAKFQKK